MASIQMTRPESPTMMDQKPRPLAKLILLFQKMKFLWLATIAKVPIHTIQDTDLALFHIAASLAQFSWGSIHLTKSAYFKV